MHRAEHLSRRGERFRLGEARDAEVGDPRASRRPFDENVLRFDVAMHDAVGVRIVERQRHVAEDVTELGQRQHRLDAEPIGE